MAERLGAHLVRAGAHAHLEAHLSLVAAVRAGVLKSAWGEGDLSVSAPFPVCSPLQTFWHFHSGVFFFGHLLHFGGKDLHAGVAHSGGEPHSGDLPAGGAVLLWLAVAIRPLRLHRGH